MILVRCQNDKEPLIVFEGEEKGLIKKIHELNLCDYHDAIFYERGKFENLGSLDEKFYDYYLVYSSREEMEKFLPILSPREEIIKVTQEMLDDLERSNGKHLVDDLFKNYKVEIINSIK